MKKKLQHFVATQYEEAGYASLAGKIRKARGVSDVRRIAIQVIKKLSALDPSGFGQDIQSIGNKGESKHG